MTAPGDDEPETDTDGEDVGQGQSSGERPPHSTERGTGGTDGSGRSSANDAPEQSRQRGTSQSPRTGQDDAGGRTGDEKQRPPPVGSDGQPRSDPVVSDEQLESWKLFTRDVVVSVLSVTLLGVYLVAISGVWPPMVAIESGSMEPNMNVNDLVFLMETDRFPPEQAHAGTGVVTARIGAETEYGNYGNSGDVIVFEPDGNGRTTPIIHRAMFWVEEGENWCEQANPQYLGGLDTSDERCIADNAGFITKGDNNGRYDQADRTRIRNPVKPEWIVGTAEARIPRLGWFRLQFL